MYIFIDSGCFLERRKVFRKTTSDKSNIMHSDDLQPAGGDRPEVKPLKQRQFLAALSDTEVKLFNHKNVTVTSCSTFTRRL